MMNPCGKLRRLTRGTGAGAGNGKMFSDWTSLHQDMLELIGWRVLAGDLRDYVRFRAVWSHWSASTARPRGRGVLDPRFHPRRWMMLPDGHGLYPGHPDLRGFVRFFNLDTGAFTRAHLPLLADHVVLDAVDGLLLLHRNDDTAVRLLHPFTGDVAEFPPLVSLLPQMDPKLARCYNERTKRRKLMTRASVTVSSSGAITLMLALLSHVAYATAGDQRWTLFELKLLLKPISFQGKLYAYHLSSFDIGVGNVCIYQFNPPCPGVDGDSDGEPRLPLPVKIAECPKDKFRFILHFVEWCSELLLVSYNDIASSKLLVYRVADLASGKFEPVTDIGDHTLFIGDRSLCFSLSPNKGTRTRSFPSMSPNSIICIHTFTDPHTPMFASFEQYDLSTGVWTRASRRYVFKKPPPSPHTLIHHIFTSCKYEFWNKGSMDSCGFETQPK